MAHKRYDNFTLIAGVTSFYDKVIKKPFCFSTALSIILLITALLVVYYPKYWNFTAISVKEHILDQGVTPEGYPWIGSSTPDITIIEFSDYMCFQCGKTHENLRKLMQQNPKKIKLIHRQFPLDSAANPIVRDQVHPNSGFISLFALHAIKNGAFWQVNDLLYQQARKQKINLTEIAKISGLDDFTTQGKIIDQSLHIKLTKDILEGIKSGVTATPSYLINGALYTGSIPDFVLNEAVKTN